ncbi:hypothetical protein Pcinc_022200, partial [Petrolisthes cinctipes]
GDEGGGGVVCTTNNNNNQQQQQQRDVCVGTSVATITDPDCLGPCEPGTSVMLEGIVWHETEGGVLVVNVTWRGKTYVGTLLDCTRHDWAPPRFCDSPTSDIESRTPKGRGKRGRAANNTNNNNTPTTTNNNNNNNTPSTTTTGTPHHHHHHHHHSNTSDLSVAETRSGKLRNANVNKGARSRGSVTPTFNPPPSPVKSEPGGTKRKGREAEAQDNKNWKRSRVSSRGTPNSGAASPGPEQPASPQLIECPEPNCNKKYKHINGLKYHQTHAHNTVTQDDETNSTEGRVESEVEESQPSSPTPVAETPVDKTTQDVVKPSVLRYTGPPPPSSPGSGPSPTTATLPTHVPGPGPGPVAPSVSGGPIDEVNKGTTTTTPTSTSTTQQLATSQPSVIQTRVPQASPMYMYTGSGGVVSPQHHPQVTASALSVAPGLSQVRPGLVRPEMMVRVGPGGPVPRPPPTTQVTPTTPQGTPLSSLPGNSPSLITVKQSLQQQQDNNSDKTKSKQELVNGVVGKEGRDEDQQPGRDDARSPAYSDISDANDTTPGMDPDTDTKDLQDDKKPELPLGAQPYPPYGMYYPSPYGQPPPFLMPPIQPPPPQPPQPPPPTSTPGKDGDGKDLKDNSKPGGEGDKSLPPPPGSSSEFLSKIPPSYLYASPFLYAHGYPDHPFLREAQMYKEAASAGVGVGGDKEVLVGVRGGGDGDNKGPTDLSRSGPGGVVGLGMGLVPVVPPPQQQPPPNTKDKLPPPPNKDSKSLDNHILLKEASHHDVKVGPLAMDKRAFDDPPMAYRYPPPPPPFDQRLAMQTQQPPPPHTQLDKQSGDGSKGMCVAKPSPTAPPMSSPRVASTPPTGPTPIPPPTSTSTNTSNKDDKKPDGKSEGVKPTMETTGPPPPPTSTAYYPSFSFNPLYDGYRTPMVPAMALPPGYPPPHFLAPPPGMVPRFPINAAVNSTPEDLSRGGSAMPMIHHHPHLYSNHKIHELQERARKSPLPPPPSGLTVTTGGLLATPPQKVASPLTTTNNTNKDGSPHAPLPPLSSSSTTTSSSSISTSIPSSTSSHGGGGGGVEGRSPPTARPPPTHHLHEAFPPYSFSPSQFHYAALQAGQTVAAGAASGLAAAAAAPPAK